MLFPTILQCSRVRTLEREPERAVPPCHGPMLRSKNLELAALVCPLLEPIDNVVAVGLTLLALAILDLSKILEKNGLRLSLLDVAPDLVK